MILTLGNVLARVDGPDPELDWLSDYLSFEDSRAFFAKGRRGDGKIRMFNRFGSTVPSGFKAMIADAAAKEGIKVDVIDKRVRPCEPDLTADVAWLRDYQLAAVEAVEHEGRGILHMATGAGKTEVFAALTRRLPCRWLFLVHRNTLVQQAAERVELRTGIQVGRIAEGTWASWDDHEVICASFQSLHAALKCNKHTAYSQGVDSSVGALLEGAQGVCSDECFPATADVDGKPIHKIRVGDLVPSFDEGTQTFCKRRVLKVWKTPAHDLVRVHLTSSRSFICTSGHPFLTFSNGWLPALSLAGQDVLHCAHDMFNLRGDFRAERTTDLRHEEAQHAACLLARLPAQAASDREGTQGDQCANDEKQPHGKAEQHRQDGSCTASTRGLATEGARRERNGADDSASDAVRTAWGGMDDGVGGTDESAAPTLQAGHRAPNGASGGGDRRGDAQDEARTGARCEEGSDAHWARVARVEVLEPRGDEERERLCPGGLVYNLHVEGTENYVVNGVVAHNCHVLPADSYLSVINRTKNAYWRVGLSGTPLARGDRRSVLAIGAIGKIIHRVRADALVEAGILARPKIKMVPVSQESDKPTYQGVYGELVVRSPKRNRAVVAAVRAAEKPCMVFVKELKHGRILEEMLGRAGLSVSFVSGQHSTDWRRSHVKGLEQGRFDALIASVVFQEGIDIPDLRSVVIACGGKSVIAALQRVGRGMRKAAGKDTFQVWDLADDGCKMLKRQAQARMRAYLAEKFEVTMAGGQLSTFQAG